jgi:hypothetical protein
VERFNLRTLNELEFRERASDQDLEEVRSFGNLNHSKDINRTWENNK